MDKITFKHFRTLITSQPFFVWNKISIDEDLDEINLENVWDLDFDYADSNFAKVIMSTFSKITNKFSEILKKQGAEILVGNIEEKISKTKEAFGTKKILINPVFEYRGAIAKPFAFDFKNNIAYEVKYSKKTKRMDFMKAYYQKEIMSKNNIILKDYWFYLPANERGPKGKVNLTGTNRVSITKSGNSYDEENKKGELKSFPIMKLFKMKQKFIIKSIDLYIDQIESARDFKKIDNNLSKDVTEFGHNQFWDYLLEKLNNKWSGYNGKIVSKKEISEGFIQTNITLEKILEITYPKIIDESMVNKIINLINKSSKVVWYDFEGFSLPYPAINNTKPYQQISFQVSKIVTNKDMGEIEKNNLVLDPKTLDKVSLFKIIETVYSGKADYYIVYNKAYENSRLKEIVELLYDHPKYNDAKNMVGHIIEKTIDLMALFQINSKNKLPPILMHDQKGKGSIKNIEKHISINKFDIGYKIKEYKNLDIKNGGMAMQIAIERATGVMGDNEWNNKMEKLKEYCENDVRAMIMVYFYILFLKKNQK